MIAQVRKHVIEQAGDEWDRLLLLVASINHVQERRQDLQERDHKKTESAEAGDSAGPSSGWTSPPKKTLGCGLGSRETPELPREGRPACTDPQAGHLACEGGPVGGALTSARRDRACTLYTDGADADTIAAAVAGASADRKRHLCFSHEGWATIHPPKASHRRVTSPSFHAEYVMFSISVFDSSSKHLGTVIKHLSTAALSSSPLSALSRSQSVNSPMVTQLTAPPLSHRPDSSLF